jgi:hypothetical protein
MLDGPHSYSYPTHKTGTAQDLMSMVTRSYELHLARTGTVLPSKSDWERLVVEPPFILGGLSVAAALELAPAGRAMAFHNWLFNTLASPHRYEFDAAAPQIERARELARRLEAETGKAPALLALISHPPVLGDMAHLNFALVRHAMLAMGAIRGGPCKPRLLVATDFFALDTIPVFQEGLYAGFMGSYHLGFDRMSVSRKPLSRFLLRPSAWTNTPSRLLRLLADGREAGLVLAGGVPSTTRILYAVREWLGDVRRRSPMRARPAEVLRRLRADEEFSRFCAAAPLGDALSRSAWRLSEAWAMAALAGVFTGKTGSTPSGADTGELPDAARGCLLRCLDALGLDSGASGAELERLSNELRRETPFRARFFRALAARVLEKGRPAVLIPVAHSTAPSLGVHAGESWGWRSGARGEVKALAADGKDWSGSPAEFASLFGKENFK